MDKNLALCRKTLFFWILGTFFLLGSFLRMAIMDGGEERMGGGPDLHSFRLKSDAQKIQKGGIYIIWRTLIKNNSRFSSR